MKTALIIAAIYGTLASGEFVRAPYAVKVGEWTKVKAIIERAVELGRETNGGVQ